MRKIIKAGLLFLIVTLLLATPVLAYLYRAPLIIVESDSNAYTMLPLITSANNQWMADNGFMEADALDTRVQTLGGLNKPHMVSDNRTATAVPVPANSQTNLYFVTGEAGLSAMDIIVGYDGYVTIPDALAIELGNNFEVEVDGYIDTTGVGDNLASKLDAFRLYISNTDNITAEVKPQIIEDCEDAWTQIGAGLTATLDNVDYQVGAGSAKFSQDGTGIIQLEAFENFGAIDIKDYTQIIMWVKSSIILNGGDLQIFLDDTPGCGSPLEMLDIPNLAANVWTQVTMNLANPALDTAIVSIGLYSFVDKGIWVMNIDDVKVVAGIQVTATGIISGEHIVTVRTELRTDTFYPDAGVNSVDGDVTHSIALGTLVWNDLTTGVGTGATDGANTFYAFRLINHADVNEYRTLFRGVALFDTAALPDTAVVTSATLSIYGDLKVDPQNNLPNIGVYSSAPALDNALAAGDYDSLGAVAFSDNITYAGFDDNGYNDFALNASGLAAIDVAGISKFGFRNSNYDVDNIAPVWAASSTTYFRVFAIEQGVAFAPKLEVSYYELVIYIDTVEEDRVVLGAGVLNTADDWEIMVGNCIPYMDYMTIDVGGAEALRYQPIAIISGTTLPDRTGTNHGVITWGANPAGVSSSLGSMSSSGQPAIGATIEDLPGSVLPEATVSDWYGDGTVGGSILTNPIRPFITMVSDNTTITEIQVWRWMGIALLLFIAVATARTLRGHLGITIIVVAAAMGGLVAVDHNIFPMWMLVLAVGMFIGGIVKESSPTL